MLIVVLNAHLICVAYRSAKFIKCLLIVLYSYGVMVCWCMCRWKHWVQKVRGWQRYIPIRLKTFAVNKLRLNRTGKNFAKRLTNILICCHYVWLVGVDKKLIRRWDSEHELSVWRHRARTTKYNRLVHSATDRRGGYVWNACLPNSVK